MKLYWNGDVGYLSSDGSGMTAASIKEALDNAGGAAIEVELFTYGGDFWEGVQIMNLVRAYQGPKTVYINGLVASAGTLIAIAFDKVVARPTSMWMIHNAQSWGSGDQNDLREAANRIEQMSNLVADEYVKKTGMSLADVKAMMDKETWIVGKGIVDAGFADVFEDTGDQSQTQPADLQLHAAKNNFKMHATMWAKGPGAVTLEDKVMAASKANANRLIAAGDVDKDTTWTFTKADQDALLGAEGDDWANYRLWHLVQDTAATANTKERFKYPYGKDGKVFRSALRSIASRASQQGLTDLSDWASAAIKKIDAKGENRVNKEQVLAWLKDNPGVPLTELAAAMGQASMVVSAEHTAAMTLVAKLAAEKITDPIATIAQLRADLSAVETDRVSNALTAAFGAAKHENGVENELRKYADLKLAGVKSTELAAKIEEFKKDSIALRLAGERMDVNSAQNVFGVLDKGGSRKEPTMSTYHGAPVVEV